MVFWIILNENNKIIWFFGFVSSFSLKTIQNRFLNSKVVKSIENHFFDLNMDLYGEKIEVFLNFKIRDEIKFSSLKELQKQIIIDKQRCINYLSKL